MRGNVIAAVVSLAGGVFTSVPVMAGDSVSMNAPNPQAISEVEAGTRSDANAAWWGFDQEDATETLQTALESKAKTVTVPYMGAPWIIRPVNLRSNLELIFEPGVLVLAKEGEFKGRGDSLFRAKDMTDITVRGYGATLRMRKKDYQSEAYEKAEWRMGMTFTGCKRVLVEGLRVESTGGDGFYIGATGANPWCEDVTIRNCICHDNHRQGLSVIGAVNLLIENCVFSGTSGTAPESGIDLEPNGPENRLVNCVIRNCVFENNDGHAMLVYLRPLNRESEPVSIRFENCVARMGSPGMTLEDFTDIDIEAGAGIAVGAIGDEAPKGLIEFVHCTTENTGEESVKVFDKSPSAALVRFVNCNWKQPWVGAHRNYGGLRVPILLQGRRSGIAKNVGGVEFENCHVFDTVARPGLAFIASDPEIKVRDIHGSLFTHKPSEPKAILGPEPENVSLTIADVSP